MCSALARQQLSGPLDLAMVVMFEFGTKTEQDKETRRQEDKKKCALIHELQRKEAFFLVIDAECPKSDSMHVRPRTV